MRESTSAGIRQIKISPNFDFFDFFDFSTSRTIRKIFCPPNFPAIRYFTHYSPIGYVRLSLTHL